MFALAEALYAHGHVYDSCQLAKELAEEMISFTPDAAAEHLAGKGDSGMI